MLANRRFRLGLTDFPVPGCASVTPFYRLNVGPGLATAENPCYRRGGRL
jgi:hypothetical protein